jgi:hypothetical protein
VQFATLYGTIFAATAGNCRAFADMAGLLGAFKRDGLRRSHQISRSLHLDGVDHTGLPLLCFPISRQYGESGGVAQAAMLPILSIGALYLRHKRLPKAVAPNLLTDVVLWIAALTIIIVVGYSSVANCWACCGRRSRRVMPTSARPGDGAAYTQGLTLRITRHRKNAASMKDLLALLRRSRVFDLAQPYFAGMPHHSTHAAVSLRHD